jgi:hypothetical protein
LIEACDRLGQKLDEVAGLFREQIEAWRQIRPPTVQPAKRENAGHPGVEAPATGRASSVKETPQASGLPGSPPPPAPTAQTSPMPEQRSRSSRTATLAPPPTPQADPHAQDEPSGDRAPAPQPGAPPDDGLVEMAQGARSLADTLSRSGQSWPEQAAGVQQALEGVMTYLENQAATAAPKVDLDGILSRLKDLEEQQQNMQSQFNNNR